MVSGSATGRPMSLDSPCFSAHQLQRRKCCHHGRSRHLEDDASCTSSVGEKQNVRSTCDKCAPRVWATHPMPRRHEATLHVLEAKLADPHSSIWNKRVLFRKGRLIPSVDVVLFEANTLDSTCDPRLCSCCRHSRWFRRYRSTWCLFSWSRRRDGRAWRARHVTKTQSSACSSADKTAKVAGGAAVADTWACKPVRRALRRAC